MNSKFTKEALKCVVAQTCHVVGFHGSNTIPLEVLTDLLHRYLAKLATETHRYAEHCGRTGVILEDLFMVFKDLGITTEALQDYMTNVEPFPFPTPVPKYPIPRNSSLNFLKPGSQEILSRPIHIHEHLPPMHPENDESLAQGNDGADDSDHDKSFESPLSPGRQSKHQDGSGLSHSYRSLRDDEGQPVREIDSVMMTTSGFISSARAGKLPEARPPNLALPMIHSSMTKNKDSMIKKKVTMEKIIRHKTQNGQNSSNRNKLKDGKLKPKIPFAPPGTNHLKIGSPKVTPKLKIPQPKTKNADDDYVADPTYQNSAEREMKKEEMRSKERRRDEHKEKKKERIRMRMRGLSKEEELKRYKEREQELIAALAASSTTTSHVPSPVRVREKTPEKKKDKVRIKGKGVSKEEELKRYKEREQKLVSALSVSSPGTSTSQSFQNSRNKDKFPGSNTSNSKSSSFSKSKFKDAKSPRNSLMMIDIQNIKEEKVDPPEEEVPSFDSFSHFGKSPTPKASSSTNSIEKFPSQTKSKGVNSRKPTHSKSPRRSKKVKKSPPKNIFHDENASHFSSPVSEDFRASSLAEQLTFAPPTIPNNPSFIPPFAKFAYSEMENHLSPNNTFSTYEQSNPVREYEGMQDQATPSFVPSNPTFPQVEPNPVFETSSNIKPEKRKEHKKDKKNKDKDLDRIKIKKKKDKKDKEKSKEEKKRLKEQLKLERKEKKREKKEESSAIPKITLKIQTDEGAPQASSVVIKTPTETPFYHPAPNFPPEDEPGSPEIAKISPLMTRPPKSLHHIKSPKRPTVPPLKIKDPSVKQIERKEKKRKRPSFSSDSDSEISNNNFIAPAPPVPEHPRHKEARKFSPPNTSQAKGGLITETVGPIGHFLDDQGNEVWICPTCGKQDDGSPMIGCDTCDDWYHWLCVGIQVAPNEHDNWYCPRCVTKRSQRGLDSTDKKKRGRKRKNT